jgi:AcrR family transcriptional regulator
MPPAPPSASTRTLVPFSSKLSSVIVKKPGRPSKAAERRAQILTAMAAVIAREGIAATTLAKVASQAGFHRTLVAHYFGDRRSLIDAFIDQAAAIYGDRQILGDQAARIETRVERLFEPGHYATHEDLIVWTELAALAARDDHVRQRLRSLWEDRWLPSIEEQLHNARPKAEPAKVSEVAYGLACLAESHWNLGLQGVATPQRRRQAQSAARLLLASLPT